MKSKGGNMSQFDKYSTVEYVEGMESFLNKQSEIVFADTNLSQPDITKPNRPGRFLIEVIGALEEEVNAKAARADAADTTFGERLKLAMDYKYFSAAQVAKFIGVSRKLVDLWGENLHRPSDIEKLAAVLDIPVRWLEIGGAQYLPANSHLGLRVGQENFDSKESLYAKTLEIIPNIPEDAEPGYAQAMIEYHVNSDPIMSELTRKGGGRWQILEGSLVFVPWISIAPYSFTRRKWSDEIEAMMVDELSKKRSVYSAYASLKKRWESMGLTKGQYPTKIYLYKHIEKERDQAIKYGLNVNEMIKISVNRYKIS